MKVVVPLRTGTGQNDREHFRARARRVKHERLAVAWMLAVHKPPAGPVTVTLCRVSPGNGLDAHDNLRGSLKAPVDQVAEWLGRDDRDPSITWAYEQRRGKPGEWSVHIDVSELAADGNCKGMRHISSVDERGPLIPAGQWAYEVGNARAGGQDVDEPGPASVNDLGFREKSKSPGVNRFVHALNGEVKAADNCQTTALHFGDAP